MNEKKEHIYLIQEREFIKTEEPIYKLGKTHDIFQRKSGYPKGSILKFCIEIDKKYSMEKFAINQFNSLFEKQKEIGNEYYKGNLHEMIKELHQIYNNFIKQENEVKQIEQIEQVEQVDKVDVMDIEPIYEQDYIENKYRDFIEDRGIQKFIIIDYEKETGFAKFPNQPWRKLSHKDCLEYNEETLNDFTDNDEELTKYIKDKFYTKNIKYYELKNHEYIICNSTNERSNKSTFSIIDANTKTVVDYDDYMNRGIIKNNKCSGRIIKNFKISNINTEIVDEILSHFIKSKNIIQKFKTFSKNIFVNNTNNNNSVNIFYDYCTSREGNILSEWLCDMYYTLTGESSLSYKDYYDRGKNGFHLFHPINSKGIYELKYIPRIGFIKGDYKGKRIYEQIIELQNLGIKNIIVASKEFPQKSIYNNINFYELVNNNKKKLFRYISNEFTNVDDSFGCINDIFYKTELYLNNFIMWVIS